MGTESGSRQRRTFTVAAAVVFGSWLALRAAPAAVSRISDARELLESRRTLLLRLERELAGLDALADTAKQLQARVVALAPRILTGTSPAEAGADLVGRITHAADVGMVKLTSAEPMTDSAVVGGLRRVGVRMGFEGDIRGVVGTLQALERDPGALEFDDLKVLALEPMGEANRPEVLRAELTVHGWHQAKVKPR